MSDFQSRISNFLFPDAEFDADVSKTYFALRVWLAGIGGLLPFVLIGVGIAAGVPWHDMSSMSAFHWLNGVTRDIFVGALCAIGLTLIIYHGYGRTEDWLLNFAGIAVTVVALSPMPWPPSSHPGMSFDLHYDAAITFFALIAATVFLCARKSLGPPVPESERRIWIGIYNGFAFAMILFPALSVAFSDSGHLTFWLESSGVGVFAAYWITKTYELRYVSQIEPKDKPIARVRWEAGELRHL